MSMEIRDHRWFIDGKQTAYQATPNKGGVISVDGIVLHDTAGDLPGTGSVSWLCNPDANASAHVVIGRGPRAVRTQLAPFNIKTWHAGTSSYEGRSNCNNFTIGIEISNPGKLAPHGDGRFRNGTAAKPGVVVSSADGDIERRATPEHGDGWWMAYSPEQVEDVKQLCAALKAAYPSIKFITTHWFIAPKRKVDTNPLFPLDEVRRHVFGVPMPTPRPDVPVPTPAPRPPVGDGKTGVVTATTLNFRRSPGGALAGSLPRGTKVVINSREGDWLNVTTPGGYTGYVHGGYVKID